MLLESAFCQCKVIYGCHKPFGAAWPPLQVEMVGTRAQDQGRQGNARVGRGRKRLELGSDRMGRRVDQGGNWAVLAAAVCVNILNSFLALIPWPGSTQTCAIHRTGTDLSKPHWLAGRQDHNHFLNLFFLIAQWGRALQCETFWDDRFFTPALVGSRTDAKSTSRVDWAPTRLGQWFSQTF